MDETDTLPHSTTHFFPDRSQTLYYGNKKCHSHVTNAPKGIGLAKDTFEES